MRRRTRPTDEQVDLERRAAEMDARAIDLERRLRRVQQTVAATMEAVRAEQRRWKERTT